MSEGRLRRLLPQHCDFRDWIGEETAIDAIDEARLEGFFNHLSSAGRRGKVLRPSYAHTLLMTAKQFIAAWPN